MSAAFGLQPLALEHLKHRQSCRSRHGIAAECREKSEPCLKCLDHGSARDDDPDRDSRCQPACRESRCPARSPRRSNPQKCEPERPEPVLHFVGDDQRAGRPQRCRERRNPRRRRIENPAARQCGVDIRTPPVRSRVRQARLAHAGHRCARPRAAPGSGHRPPAGRPAAPAASPPGDLRPAGAGRERRNGVRDPVIGMLHDQRAPMAGRRLGDAPCHIVRFAAGIDEHAGIEMGRQPRGEPLRVLEDALVQIAACGSRASRSGSGWRRPRRDVHGRRGHVVVDVEIGRPSASTAKRPRRARGAAARRRTTLRPPRAAAHGVAAGAQQAIAWPAASCQTAVNAPLPSDPSRSSESPARRRRRPHRRGTGRIVPAAPGMHAVRSLRGEPRSGRRDTRLRPAAAEAPRRRPAAAPAAPRWGRVLGEQFGHGDGRLRAPVARMIMSPKSTMPTIDWDAASTSRLCAWQSPWIACLRQAPQRRQTLRDGGGRRRDQSLCCAPPRCGPHELREFGQAAHVPDQGCAKRRMKKSLQRAVQAARASPRDLRSSAASAVAADSSCPGQIADQQVDAGTSRIEGTDRLPRRVGSSLGTGSAGSLLARGGAARRSGSRRFARRPLHLEF